MCVWKRRKVKKQFLELEGSFGSIPCRRAATSVREYDQIILGVPAASVHMLSCFGVRGMAHDDGLLQSQDFAKVRGGLAKLVCLLIPTSGSFSMLYIFIIVLHSFPENIFLVLLAMMA